MSYEETIEYLYRCAPSFQNVGAPAYKEGLQNTLELDRHFGHPHRHFKTIHVAGTNGKGSCSHTLAAILQADGYRVGLYTSPHLIDFRERIRVNGECVGEQYVVDFVEKERHFFEPLHPSFFELTTALAFKYFADQQVDIAVIEVGLGGRLDCTNIISPALSVITNISYDHTQFLGDTLAKIATEKAGIIKHSTPVVIGEGHTETAPVFRATASHVGAPIVFAEDEPQVERCLPGSEGTTVIDTRDFGRLTFALAGAYQQRNANTILAAVRELMEQGVIRHKDSVAQGFASVVEATGLMGRWQTLGDEPRVVCDTGHNVAGWQYLSRQISGQPCDRLRMVFGMVDDKDIDTVAGLLPRDATYYFTQATTHRAIPAARIQQTCQAHGLQGEAFPTVADAYAKALADAGKGDFIFVGGSSYVVADLLAFLR